MAKSKTPPVELYYFWKDHCAPCKAAHPIVERVAAALALPLTSLDARAKESEGLILGFNVMAVPTLVVVQHKHKVASLIGADLQNEQKLTKQLAKYLES